MRSILRMLLFTGVLIPWCISAQATKVNDFPRYDVELELLPGRQLLDATVVLKIDSSFIKKGSLELFLNPNADIRYIVSDPATEIIIDSLDGDRSMITLNTNNSKIAELTLNLAYSLHIPEDHPVNRITEEWIELNIDSFWLPQINDFPRFHYTMNLKIDPTYTVMTGDNILKAEREGQWVISDILPRLDISFSAAKKFHLAEGAYVMVSALHADTKIDSIKIVADRAMAFLNAYIAQPKDFREKRIVIVSPRKDVGYSRKNYIVLSDVRNRNAVSLAGFLCHEFAHYWFSEANSGTKHHWLSESFAEYLSMIFVREEYGTAAFDDFIREKQNRIKDDIKPLAAYEGRPSYLAMYVKGPLILHQFEQYIGKENFELLINRFVDQTITTNEELFQLIESLFGKEAVVELERLRGSI